jgi:hypothetical protein
MSYSNIWSTQMASDWRTNSWYVRNQNNGTWGSWSTLLHSGNFNSYAPTLTGVGASGTWGIGITGNAATATTAVNSDTVDGYHMNQNVLTTSSPTFNSAYTSNWFRSTGSTGWYSETYGGGWYMIDTTWIRGYGGKSLWMGTGHMGTDG